MLAKKGIRVNAVAPGPIWTPLIPSTMPEDAVRNFGEQVPLRRAGQPAELATAYVMLANRRATRPELPSLSPAASHSSRP
jgi:NAD(P)-dependent dehydrogenase (short-subunit alcohol dehydrogenase family)